MGDLHPSQLHQLMRSWLLAEDPYGLNQRKEPTFPDTRASKAGEKAVAGATAPPAAEEPRDEKAQLVGEAAVKGALDPSVYGESEENAQKPRPYTADEIKNRARAKMPAPNWTSPEESAAYAKGVGQSAVEGAVGSQAPAPFPLSPHFPDPMPMTPPGTYFGPDAVTNEEGRWWPGEASAAARSLGRNAVERELTDKQPE